MGETSSAKQEIAKAVDQRNTYLNPLMVGVITSLVVTVILLKWWAWNLSGWEAAGSVVFVLVLSLVKLVAFATYRQRLADSFERMKEIAECLECSDSRQEAFLKVFRPQQEAIDKELTRIAALMLQYRGELEMLYAHGVPVASESVLEPNVLDVLKRDFQRRVVGSESMFNYWRDEYDKLHHVVRTMGYSVRPTWAEYAIPTVPSNVAMS